MDSIFSKGISNCLPVFKSSSSSKAVTTEMATITAAIRQESLNLKGKPEARAKAQKALEKLNKELVKLQKQLAKLEKQ